MGQDNVQAPEGGKQPLAFPGAMALPRSLPRWLICFGGDSYGL